MYSPEGMISRTVYLYKMVLRTTGGGPEAMDRAITACISEQTNNAEGDIRNHLRTRRQLAINPYLVLLIDIPGIFGRSVCLLSETAQFPLPFDTKKLRNYSFTPSYAGLSIASDNGALGVNLHIPMEQIRSGFQLFQFLESNKR
jgi:hypothetical protein